jgi:hypothetical protein
LNISTSRENAREGWRVGEEEDDEKEACPKAGELASTANVSEDESEIYMKRCGV